MLSSHRTDSRLRLNKLTKVDITVPLSLLSGPVFHQCLVVITTRSFLEAVYTAKLHKKIEFNGSDQYFTAGKTNHKPTNQPTHPPTQNNNNNTQTNKKT